MKTLNELSKNIISVQCESDISTAVRCVRRAAEELEFSSIKIYYLATVASELATNLYFHAGGGIFEVLALDGNKGIEIRTIDHGPGIVDIEAAMEEGFSTGEGLGCGLPGVKRLMDNLSIESAPGLLTTVRASKWR